MRIYRTPNYKLISKVSISEELFNFFKTQKKYQDGKFTMGFYFNHTEENRPHLIPVYPFAGGSVNGNGVEGPALSQVTSGFYYTPSSGLWRKHEKYIFESIFPK